MQISNGAGGPVSNAGVDTRNRLLTYSTSREESLSYTYDGRAFSSFISVTPSIGSTIFFMIGSNTATTPVVVDVVNLASVADERVDVLVGPYATPTVVGSTNTSPVNKNVATVRPCPWTVSIGTGITTTSTMTEIDSIRVHDTSTYTFKTPIILQPGYCLALRTSSGNSAIKGSVQFYLLEGTTLGSWSE
jgi:hypothetical protein